jgi:hypothetical protein
MLPIKDDDPGRPAIEFPFRTRELPLLERTNLKPLRVFGSWGSPFPMSVGKFATQFQPNPNRIYIKTL